MVCAVDEVSDSAVKCHHRLSPAHKPVDTQHLLPLSVEAQFVRQVIDRVSYQIIDCVSTVNYLLCAHSYSLSQLDSSVLNTVQCVSVVNVSVKDCCHSE